MSFISGLALVHISFGHFQSFKDAQHILHWSLPQIALISLSHQCHYQLAFLVFCFLLEFRPTVECLSVCLWAAASASVELDKGISGNNKIRKVFENQ